MRKEQGYIEHAFLILVFCGLAMKTLLVVGSYERKMLHVVEKAEDATKDDSDA